MALIKKKKSTDWYEELSKMGVKVDHVTDRNNAVVKKISAKNLKAVKEAGYRVKRIPNGSIVILHK